MHAISFDVHLRHGPLIEHLLIGIEQLEGAEDGTLGSRDER